MQGRKRIALKKADDVANYTRTRYNAEKYCVGHLLIACKIEISFAKRSGT
jgi:hypothetical protein